MSEIQNSTPRFWRSGADVIDGETDKKIGAGFDHKLAAADACGLLNANPECVTGYEWEDAK